MINQMCMHSYQLCNLSVQVCMQTHACVTSFRISLSENNVQNKIMFEIALPLSLHNLTAAPLTVLVSYVTLFLPFCFS